MFRPHARPRHVQLPRMRIALLCLCLLPSAAQAAPPQSQTAARLSDEVLVTRMDRWIQPLLQRSLFSGVVLVARDGKPIFRRAYGFADYAAKPPKPMTPETAMGIFSMTKQFTASCILLLQERGQLSVSDPVGKYFPDWPKGWADVTLHHLLTHTAGIDMEEEASWWDAQQGGKGRDPGWKPKKVVDPRQRHKPGTKFQYSNTGYVLLAGIVERVSGKSYRDFLRENVFLPLGMKDSDAYQPDVKPRRAPGHVVTGGPPIAAEQQTSYILGAGDIYTTVDDLLKWDQGLYGTFLKPESRQAMFCRWTDNGFGYGWIDGKLNGHAHSSHGGAGLGFASQIDRLPDDRLTVIVLSNLSGFIDFPVPDALCRMALGEELPTPAFPEVRRALLDTYHGEYSMGRGAAKLLVRIGPGRGPAPLQLQLIGAPDLFWLHPISDTAFTCGCLVVRFERDRKGKVSSLLLVTGADGKPRHLKRSAPHEPKGAPPQP